MNLGTENFSLFVGQMNQAFFSAKQEEAKL